MAHAPLRFWFLGSVWTVQPKSGIFVRENFEFQYQDFKGHSLNLVVDKAVLY